MRDLSGLRKICSAGLPYFYQFGRVAEVQSKIKGDRLFKGGCYIFGDRGGSVLGVAHLDYIQIPFHWAVADLNGLTVFCPRLDDRLGVWLLLEVLPGLVDSPFDILLTTGEERGKSSASAFVPVKSYNWVFELDRRGCDVVTYGIESKAWRASLGEAQFSIGRGSFSDICCLDVGCCAVNVGIGYQEEHTRICHAFMADVDKQVSRFVKFYNTNCGSAYEAEPVYHHRGYSRALFDSGSYQSGYDWSTWGSDTCAYCGGDLSEEIPYIVGGQVVCGACYKYLFD